VISAGPITIDPEKREARVHGDMLVLDADKFDLLEVLASEPYREWTERELLDRVRLAHHGWLVWVRRDLAAKLTRVGIEHDLARTDGLYRLFKPEQGGDDAQS
jgi:hypothetical protein